MSPKHHPTLMSGGDRKALKKELRVARGMTRILADQAAEMRTRGEALLRQADKLSCESWNVIRRGVRAPIGSGVNMLSQAGSSA
ncbi:hypothetical protein FIU28_16675 [Tardiphaga sp. vice154]|nr:hypothetical protein FIU28_16675 [Tardiphaga sp. vice154]